MAAIVRLDTLGWDADNPHRLAEFWAVALRWEIAGRIGGAITLIPPDDADRAIAFRSAREPKTGKNPVHLDLTTGCVADQKTTATDLIGLGASDVDVGQGADDGQIVLADPEGNEFCLIEPDNSFLAGRGRLGSITCDGSPEVGYFWSRALGWPLVWDQDGETAIRPADGRGPLITWGPPVPPANATCRLHLEVAPAGDGGPSAAIERLISLGAARLEGGAGNPVRMADPDGCEFRLSTTISGAPT